MFLLLIIRTQKVAFISWTQVEFKWKEGAAYDATKTYKLAIVCSSSKDGANFNGAANSTLIVDELEVIGE